MTEAEAVDVLVGAVALNGMGTFSDSPVVAVWHDGTQVPLGSYGDLKRAVMALVSARGDRTEEE